ncbi:MAG: 50S ribosomal protein L22 [Mycoplasmataceae bacterium]|nr:50S ribosomal protein L22 [Mycoplasmataceae bacterium]MDD7685921.1 50S ribosomal protein L22 [Mycoplasmataceae bacterium]
MKTTATQNNIHVSSQKANLVCDLVRGLPVTKALVILDNTPAKSAKFIKKLLNQAIANATNNHSMNAANLYIYAITANQGKTLKRMLPRAKGSSNQIRKRFINLVLTLSDDKNQKAKDLLQVKAKIAKRNQHKNQVNKAATVKKAQPAKKPASTKIKIAKEGAKK